MMMVERLVVIVVVGCYCCCGGCLGSLSSPATTPVTVKPRSFSLLDGGSAAVDSSAGLGGRRSSLKYIAEWCHIGCQNITTSHTWANLAIPKHSNARTTDGFFSNYKTPSILPMPATGVWTRNVGMDAGWEVVLHKFATQVVLPRLANKTAIGVFLGDEICCRNSSCWHTTLNPISAKLRSLLGKEAILWSNECGIPALFDKLDKIPPDLDWISIDACKLYPLPSFNPELGHATRILSQLKPHWIFRRYGVQPCTARWSQGSCWKPSFCREGDLSSHVALAEARGCPWHLCVFELFVHAAGEQLAFGDFQAAGVL